MAGRIVKSSLTLPQTSRYSVELSAFRHGRFKSLHLANPHVHHLVISALQFLASTSSIRNPPNGLECGLRDIVPMLRPIAATSAFLVEPSSTASFLANDDYCLAHLGLRLQDRNSYLASSRSLLIHSPHLEILVLSDQLDRPYYNTVTSTISTSRDGPRNFHCHQPSW